MRRTIILADDHQIIREGLRHLLEQEKGLEVVAEAENGRVAVELAKKLIPDLVVMDIGMPELNGVEATRQITANGERQRSLPCRCILRRSSSAACSKPAHRGTFLRIARPKSW